MEEGRKPQDENNARSDQRNEQNELKAERDISTIDRQEGNLKHGELGGDPVLDKEEEHKKAPR